MAAKKRKAARAAKPAARAAPKCESCSPLCTILVLVLGVLFLLQDMGRLELWGISGITVAYLLIGICMLKKSM